MYVIVHYYYFTSDDIMRSCLIIVWFLYWLNKSALAVGDGVQGIGLSSELKTEIDEYVSSVISILTEKYENRISELENELAIQKQRIEKLEANERIYKSVLGNCLSNAGKLAEDKGNAEDTVAEDVRTTERSTEEENTQHGISRSRKDTSRIRRDVEHRVAFFASLTDDLNNMGQNQDIAFDKVVTNLGNAYNGHHGTFVAPVAGTYVLCVTLRAQEPGTWGHFVINGNVVAKLDSIHQQTSHTIIVTLKLGDDVSIQNTVLSRGITGDSYSTFSGFLLYEDFTSSTIIG